MTIAESRRGHNFTALSRLAVFTFLALLLEPSLADDQEAFSHPGKAVYKKANCVGCHKWHGGGGGGYGGVALSLRATVLDAETLKLVIRCGRPGTRMPYHHRKAYRGEDRSCYETTAAELGDAAPPRARFFLRQPAIDDVVDYIQRYVQGRGTPNHEDCVRFWGPNARRCRAMAAAESASKEQDNK